MQLQLNVPNEVPAAFHNGSNYDFHLLMVHLFIKELANKFEGQLGCLGKVQKSNEKYKTFSVPIEKEITKIDSDENVVTNPTK